MKLTDAQKEIVNYDQLGTMIVKGTAGSGKSLVGLHRINYFFNRKNSSLFPEEKECKVLVVAFNKIMIYQLQHSFEEIRNSDVKMRDVKFINIDKIMSSASSKAALEKNYQIIFNDFETKLAINLFNTQRNKYSNEFILDEFNWIRNNLITTKQEYFDIVRLGRGKKRLNKEDREYIWELLKKYRERMVSQKKIDYLDACILALRKNNFSNFLDYNHIIVDEAQDLSKLKLMFITGINKLNLEKAENSLMFLYDSSQSVYDESWLGYGRPFSSIGLNVKKIKKLEVSYRTTRQIHQAANSLISYYKDQNPDKETELNPVFAGNEEGINPITFRFNNKEDEIETFVAIIKNLAKKGYDYKDIMIVAFTNNDLKELDNFLFRERIPAHILTGDGIEKNRIKLSDNKIKLLSVNNAKGLESKIVFIFNTEALSYINKNEEKDENEVQIRNTKKLYTAMTRAQELLFISEDEKYIDKIDEKYLTKIDDYHNLDIDSYLAADLDANDFLINANKTDRFSKIRQAYKAQAEEEEKIVKASEVKVQESLIRLLTNNNSDLRGKIEDTFKDLDTRYKKMILEAELLYFAYKSNFLNGSLVYIAYAKIIEHMLREFLEIQDKAEKKLTLGGIICQIKSIRGMKNIFYNICYIDLLYNRNDATHNELKDDRQVEVIRKYLIEEEGVLKLRDAIHEELSLVQEEIKKEGNLVNNYTIITFNQKEYCSYLLDNDDLVIYKKKLPEGKYKLTGHYISKSGKKYYRIDHYEKTN